MNPRNFDSYFAEYDEFYDGILELAKLEDKSLKEELSSEEINKYNKIIEAINISCPEGITLKDLIWVVVVGEIKRKKNYLFPHLV